MTAHEDAEKAAAEAGQGVSHDFLVECGLTDNEADAAINAVAEAAVAAAAPILLAAERAHIAAAIRETSVEFMAVAVWRVDGKRSTTAKSVYGAAMEEAARIAETAPEEGS